MPWTSVGVSPTRSYATPPLPAPSQALEFISLSWTQTFVPLVFGIDPWLFSGHGERVAFGVIGQAVVLTVAGATIMRRPAAWRPWVLLMVTVLTFSALVGLTRASIFGPGEAADVRYVAFDTFFLAICLGLMLMPVRRDAWSCHWVAARPPPSGAGWYRHSHRRSSPRQPHLWFWLLGIPALVAVVAVYTSALVFDQNHDPTVQATHASRTFFANFEKFVARSDVEGHSPLSLGH